MEYPKKKIVIRVFLALVTVVSLVLFAKTFYEKDYKLQAAVAYTGDIPSYYEKVGTTPEGLALYSMENIFDSSGKKEKLYRVYDGTYLYESGSDGQYETTPLSVDDIVAERPQPSIRGTAGSYTNDVEMNPVGPNISLRYELAGQYLFNYVASANIYGRSATNSMGGFVFDGKSGTSVPISDETYGSYIDLVNSEGTLGIPGYQMDKTIKGNASKATLKPSENSKGEALDKSNIKFAYLIMETSADTVKQFVNLSTPNDEVVPELQNMGNRPMTLVGPSGATITSNGYLPSGFSIIYDETYSSTNPALDTSSDDLSSDDPTIMYTLGGRRIRGTTITDVTDFVRKEGYGDYYGYHIPTKADKISSFADVACGWKLIVIEEDKTMPNSRVGTIQLGMINSSNANIGDQNLNITANLGGYTTPKTGDFKGQLLFSSVGTNPQSQQYLVTLDPDGTGSVPPFYLEARDRTGGNIHRGNGGTSKSFGQNIMSIDGQRRRDMTSYRLLPRGSGSPLWTLSDFLTQSTNYSFFTDGMDMELLNVTNKQSNIAVNTTKHNAYIANNAKEISLDVTPSKDGDNYITALGVLVEIESPVFNSSISHKDLSNGAVGNDVFASDKVEVTAATENVTKTTSDVVALTDTQAIVSLDSSLTVDWDTLSLSFKNFNKNGAMVEYTLADFAKTSSLNDLNTNKASNSYFIDTAQNKIIINFGTDEVVYETENDKNAGKGTTKKLYNNIGDSLEIKVTAKTSHTAKNNITNTIKVSGGDAINQNDLIVPITAKDYSISENRFNTYSLDFILNIRQVVKDGHEDLVIPTTGHGTVKSTDGNADLLAEYSLSFASSDKEQLGYDTYLIQYPKNGKKLSYHSIIPQYYQLIGYTITTNNIAHSVDDVVPKAEIDPENQEQVWLTVYLKPSASNIPTYSWDYKTNELGEVEVP